MKCDCIYYFIIEGIKKGFVKAFHHVLCVMRTFVCIHTELFYPTLNPITSVKI